MAALAHWSAQNRMPPDETLTQPLINAFKRQVLQNPDVMEILKKIRAEPDTWGGSDSKSASDKWPTWHLQRLLEGSFGLEAGLWPACADHSLRDQAGDMPVTGGLRRITPSARHVLLLVANRFGDFVAPLRNGSLIARGHLIDGQLVEISGGIWERPHVWVDFLKGDIGEFELADERDARPQFVAKWQGIELVQANPPKKLAPSNHAVRSKNVQRRVELAIQGLWPDPQNLAGIGAKERDRQINEWLKKRGLGHASAATVRRVLSSVRVAKR